jgi:bifunctional non-homologous end joining protein LigD
MKAETDNDKTITVSNRRLQLTNLNKIFWPEEKITKGDVIDYYNTVGKYILPYLKGRPESLKRNPNGISDKGFFHKDAGEDAPEWIDTKEIYAESTEQNVNYILCNNKPTLLYLANLGCIELNPWNSRIEKLDYPDYLIMDIDPSEKNNFDDVIEVALAIKDILDRAKAASFCKTSGASGIHLYVPLAARYPYEQVRAFAELLAGMAHGQIPGLSTMERSLKKREKDKVYIDYLQNSRGQTLACAYSLRPRPGATVSTPLKWSEVKKGLRPDGFNIHTIPKRITREGDLFAGVLKKGIDLEKCLSLLEN